MNNDFQIENIGFVQPPKTCGYCHYRITPGYQNLIWSPHTGYTPGSLLKERAIITWLCSNADCKRIIFAEYQFSRGHNNRPDFRFIRNLDDIPEIPDWPVVIKELQSPDGVPSRFEKIYLESLIAEQKGISEIAGMGFRKAIEFLVKDWAINQKPEECEKIKESTLMEVINNHMINGETKEILKRAVWLGNDHAHYDPYHIDYDIHDLKRLIKLFIGQLDQNWQIVRYNSEIQPKPRPN